MCSLVMMERDGVNGITDVEVFSLVELVFLLVVVVVLVNKFYKM